MYLVHSPLSNGADRSADSPRQGWSYAASRMVATPSRVGIDTVLMFAATLLAALAFAVADTVVLKPSSGFRRFAAQR